MCLRIKAQFKVSKKDSKMAKLGKNLSSGGLAGALTLTFVYSLDYAGTRLANDNKSSKTGGEHQFNGLVDGYKKTLASDGIHGLYQGFFFVCLFLQPAPENQGLAAVAHAKCFFLLINAGLWSLKHV